MGEVPWVFWGEDEKRGGVRGGRATRRDGKAKGGERSPPGPVLVGAKEFPGERGKVGECKTGCEGEVSGETA